MTQDRQKVERGAWLWMDAMRFIAALLVVVEHERDLLFVSYDHAGHLNPLWQAFYFITGYGHQAVTVFFVLSGYWIASAVERRIEWPEFWRVYLIDRLSRLLIVLVPALIVGGLLDLVSIFVLHSPFTDGHSGSLTIAFPVLANLTWQTFLGNLLFLQAGVVHCFGSNGPLWSLGYEFWFYLWFPALLMLFRYRRVSVALLSLAIVATHWGLLIGFASWLVGVALYYVDRARLWGQGGDWSARRAWIGGLLSAAFLGAALLASRLKPESDLLGLMIALGFAALVWVLLRANPPRMKSVEPLAAYGANASFSLYAFHTPFLLMLGSALPIAARGVPEIVRLGWFFALLVLAVVYAWVVSRATEHQTPVLRRWLTRVTARGGESKRGDKMARLS